MRAQIEIRPIPFALTTILAFTLIAGLEKLAVAQGQNTQENIEYAYGKLSPTAPPETAQWGQLAGVWDCTLPITSDDGSVRMAKATWIWSYTIGGHGVKDEYQGHNPSGPNFHGSGIRIFDPEKNEWEVSWIDSGSKSGNQKNLTKTYRAIYDNEQIIMSQVDGNPDWRTIFYDIEKKRFEWRNEPSGQRMTCVRTSPDS